MHDTPYDAAYFDKYRGYAATELGAELNHARLAFVDRHWPHDGPLVDIGIGCGQFVDSRNRLAIARGSDCVTTGYDVNPVGVAWLWDRGWYQQPYLSKRRPGAATFWDSLEHIEDPSALLRRIDDRVFVSLPIFRDLAHVRSSKHFRPDEHFWYFTRDGFVAFMDELGWELLEVSDFETRLGREDIGSFAFRRYF